MPHPNQNRKSSVDAIYQGVQEDPKTTSPDRIIDRVITWWG